VTFLRRISKRDPPPGTKIQSEPQNPRLFSTTNSAFGCLCAPSGSGVAVGLGGDAGLGLDRIGSQIISSRASAQAPLLFFRLTITLFS